jgi:hypothetical protein
VPDIATARRLSYISPRKALLLSMVWDAGMHLSQIEQVERLWHNRRMRWRLTMKQAALMCMGRKAMFDLEKWSFALWPEENSPVDAVFRRQRDGAPDEYEFVQLKEWVSNELNPNQSLQEVLDRLPQRYPDATGLMIGIHVNRNATTTLGDLRMPRLAGASLWFFGIGGEPFDSFLIGDLLREDMGVNCSFQHPRFQPGESPVSWRDLYD